MVQDQGVEVMQEPSAESHDEVHKHGKDPEIGVVPDEQGPASRGYGGCVLHDPLLCALLENACRDTSSCLPASQLLRNAVKQSPDLSPNADRVLNVTAHKMASIPANMSRTRARLQEAMLLI